MTGPSMEPSELPSTPSSAQHRAILVNLQGTPLKINLQAIELEGRPKLVRTLKSSGALVVSNAKEAAIILVDSSTESGKRLIRTWGLDASKVVLEYTWARASIHAGRPLLELDNWGGAMTADDGKPLTIDGVVVDEDELEEVEALVTKSPLPTPRVTPVDPISHRSHNVAAAHLDIPPPNALVPCSTGSPPPGSSTSQSIMVGATPSVKSAADINYSTSPRPATQLTPYIQSALCAQPPPQSQNTYTYPPFVTQQAAHPSQSQTMSTQTFAHTGILSSQPPMVHAPNIPHPSLPSARPQTSQTHPSSTSVNGANVQNSNLTALMTIMEVVRHMDQSNRFGQYHLSTIQSPANSNASMFPTQSVSIPGVTPLLQVNRGFESPGVDISLSSSQGRQSDIAASSHKHGFGADVSRERSTSRNVRRARPSYELSPSMSPKRLTAVKPTNPPRKRLRKGKEKAIPTDSSEHSEFDELTEASNGSYSTHSSASPPARPRNIIARKKHGEIFTSASGEPLRFFVQVDLQGRHNVVTNIKKNKGKIVNNIADADYLILFARSDTFQGLLNEAIALGKSPILSAFVADCVEESALLDEADYVLESVSKIRPLKRGRQGAFSIKIETSETLFKPNVAKPRSSATDEDRKLRRTPSKSLTDKKRKKAPNSTLYEPPVEEEQDSPISRSPTPPPAATRQLMKSGKYLFTEVEDEYFLRLAKHHLARDPTVSNTALTLKVHKKMPHHTMASWGAHIDKKVKGALEDVRKRANIANRKRVNGAVDQNSSGRFVNVGTPFMEDIRSTTEENGNISLNQSYTSREDLERQDFEVITQFFASGGGDDDDDERVWQRLEKSQQCRSAYSWPDYYAAHEKEVYARIEELMSKRTGD